LTRSAQYNPPVDYSALDVFSEEEKAKAEGNTKSPLAQRGFVHVPATRTHGGVIAAGGIRRDATLSLAALRLLAVREGAGQSPSPERTRALRRYVLGLALTAFTYVTTGYLRQGCQLVINPERPRECVEVHANGDRKPLTLTHDEAVAFARVAASAFGVGEDRETTFDKDLAKKDVTGDEKKKKGSKKN
jgi:CRISPR-associated protein Csb1